MSLDANFIEYAVAVQLGLQAWCLKEVVSLKVNVATITEENKIMKKKLGLVAIAIFVLPLLLFCGCSTTMGKGAGGSIGALMGFPGKVLDKVADATSVTTTNVVTLTQTNTIGVVSVEYQTNVVNLTNFTVAVSHPVAGSIEGATTLSGWLPPPFNTAGGIILGGASGLLALLAKRKQDQLNAHTESSNKVIDDMHDTADSLYSQLAATIKGVERAVADTKPVKEAIAKEAAKLGVTDKLNQTVQSVVS